MSWNIKLDNELMKLRSDGRTYNECSVIIGKSISSVKHRARRIQQSENNDKYKHTEEKTSQFNFIKELLSGNKSCLETNAGFGGMTEVYAKHFINVESIDIDKSRVSEVNSLGIENVTCYSGDSEKEILRLSYRNCRYDFIDVDPYGMPSRYFPEVINLIDNGVLSITFPMIGVAQMNKITIQHLLSFWGVDYKSPSEYIDKICAKMNDYGFMKKRKIEMISCEKIGRIYRLAFSVKKISLCELVGLEVNRK